MQVMSYHAISSTQAWVTLLTAGKINRNMTYPYLLWQQGWYLVHAYIHYSNPVVTI